METLERDIKRLGDALKHLPDWEVKRLDRDLGHLSPEQVAFVRETLDKAKAQQRLGEHELNLFEHFFEKWWAHSLATKLAIMSKITGLVEDKGRTANPMAISNRLTRFIRGDEADILDRLFSEQPTRSIA